MESDDPHIFLAKTAPWPVVVWVLLIIFAKKKFLPYFLAFFSNNMTSNPVFGEIIKNEHQERPVYHTGGCWRSSIRRRGSVMAKKKKIVIFWPISKKNILILDPNFYVRTHQPKQGPYVAFRWSSVGWGGPVMKQQKKIQFRSISDKNIF